MAAIYLRHPLHGEKVASTDSEANYDKGFGWVQFDPDAERAVPVVEEPKFKGPALPSFLVGNPVEVPATVVVEELVGAPVEPPKKSPGRPRKE